MNTFIQDLRYSFRVIRKTKGLALSVVLSMALGIGATASVFSLVDSFVFRPLEVPETSRVMRIANSTSASSVGRFSYPEFGDYLERNGSFAGITAYQNAIVGVASKPGDQPRVTLGLLVSGNFFSTLAIEPAAGRGFLPEEDEVPGRNAVVVISNLAWQRDFAGRKDVIGSQIEINGHSFTIVGITPENFAGVEPFIQPEIYIPRMMLNQAYGGMNLSSLTNRTVRPVELIGRLGPGVTIAQAKDDVTRISNQLELEYPETNKGTKAVVLTQFGYQTADSPDNLTFAVLLLAVAFLVLGIACVNVVNLLLSTTHARTREMAVRVAMGANRLRLIRQLLLEGVVLGGAGTLAGLAIASWCARFFSSIRIASDLPLHVDSRVDGRVVIFALAVGLVSSVVSGAIPALRCSRSDLNSLLKASDPRNRAHRIWGRQALVGTQVAATALMMVFSGLFLTDLQMSATRSPGFRVENILTMSFDPSIAQYDLEKSHRFYNQLVERVRALPGVKSAAIGQHVPLGVSGDATEIVIEGYQMRPDQQTVEIRSSTVGDGYFRTLDIPIIRGRAFDRRDGPNSPRAIIINEVMAQQYWPNRDPIGARLEIKEEGGGQAEVIGVARNSKYRSVDEGPRSFMYLSFEQSRNTGMALFVETESEPAVLTPAVRNEVRNLDPRLPIFDVRTMSDHFHGQGLLGPRLVAQVITAVGTVGLILGILGLYGVIAYSVGQRTHEIGVRMAVGASSRQVLSMVLMQGLWLSGIGVVAGTAIAFALSGAVSNMVSYVNPRDPSIYAGVIALLLAVTGVACYLPARRASMVDPNTTLRT